MGRDSFPLHDQGFWCYKSNLHILPVAGILGILIIDFPAKPLDFPVPGSLFFHPIVSMKGQFVSFLGLLLTCWWLLKMFFFFKKKYGKNLKFPGFILFRGNGI